MSLKVKTDPIGWGKAIRMHINLYYIGSYAMFGRWRDMEWQTYNLYHDLDNLNIYQQGKGDSLQLLEIGNNESGGHSTYIGVIHTVENHIMGYFLKSGLTQCNFLPSLPNIINSIIGDYLIHSNTLVDNGCGPGLFWIDEKAAKDEIPNMDNLRAINYLWRFTDEDAEGYFCVFKCLEDYYDAVTVYPKNSYIFISIARGISSNFLWQYHIRLIKEKFHYRDNFRMDFCPKNNQLNILIISEPNPKTKYVHLANSHEMVMTLFSTGRWV